MKTWTNAHLEHTTEIELYPDEGTLRHTLRIGDRQGDGIVLHLGFRATEAAAIADKLIDRLTTIRARAMMHLEADRPSFLTHSISDEQLFENPRPRP